MKLQQIIGIDLGFLRPFLMFPESAPSYILIRNSPISSGFFGSSKMKGSDERTSRSLHKVSDVLWVFIMWPTYCWPKTAAASFAAVDFPI